MRPVDSWGNELALALLSASLKRKVITITPATIWIVSIGAEELPPLFLRLRDRHYDPLQQTPTASMLEAVSAAKPAVTNHLNLEGGADIPITQMLTWNVTAYQAHSTQIQDLSDQVVTLQETGCSERAQRRFSTQAQALGLSVIWGRSTPVQRSSTRQWRTDKGAVPGVAIQLPVRATFSPSTNQDEQLLTQSERFPDVGCTHPTVHLDRLYVSHSVLLLQ